MAYELKDFRAGDRVELHPSCNLWMRGARYGNVVAVGRQALSVKLDAFVNVTRMSPCEIGEILETGDP